MEAGATNMPSKFPACLGFIVALILCLGFVAGLYYFQKNLLYYQRLQQSLERAKQTLARIRQEERERPRRIQSLNRVRSLVQQAKALGLTKDKWAGYQVKIEEPVTFSELKVILEQTEERTNYYFDPFMLLISRTIPPEQRVPERPYRGGPSEGSEMSKWDVFLKLKGRFLVRQQ